MSVDGWKPPCVLFLCLEENYCLFHAYKRTHIPFFGVTEESHFISELRWNSQSSTAPNARNVAFCASVKPRIPRKGAHALPTVGIPHEQRSAVRLPLAAGARGQARAIGAEGHAHDDPMMPRQPQELRATLGVPHIDVAIFAPTNQARAIGT